MAAATIKMLGMDPGFVNWGFCYVEVDVVTGKMNPVRIDLVRTDKSSNKQVRVSSDNLRRARLLHQARCEAETWADMIAAEIPSGAQSAKAAMAFGIVTGLVAGHSKPLIEVSPAEAKKAATGYGQANKEEMIEWAIGTWPDLDWIVNRGKPSPLNEHMADALAITKAAIATATFENAAAIMRAHLGAAA